MKNIKIIRHAESESNAGGVTLDHANINITAHGIATSLQLAADRNEPVDMIIVSKYIRTRQTAQGFIDKYPQAQVIESDLVHEYNDLDESRYHHTTKEQRRKWRDEYVLGDVYYKDGENGESLHDIEQRILQFIDYCKTLPNNTVIFSHGKFIFFLDYILNNPGNLPLKNEFKQYMYDQIRGDGGVENLYVMDLGKYL